MRVCVDGSTCTEATNRSQDARCHHSCLNKVCARHTDHVRDVLVVVLGRDAKQKVITAAHGGAVPTCFDSAPTFLMTKCPPNRVGLHALPCLHCTTICDVIVVRIPAPRAHAVVIVGGKPRMMLSSLVRWLFSRRPLHLILHFDCVLTTCGIDQVRVRSPRAYPF